MNLLGLQPPRVGGGGEGVRAGRSIAEALLVVAVGEFAAVYGVTLTTLQQSVSLHAGNVRSIRFGTQRYARL